MAIIRLSVEDADKVAIARWQLKVCHEKGLRLGGYGWLYPNASETPFRQAEAWLMLAEGYPIEIIYVDCEDEGDPGVDLTVASIAQALNTLNDNRMLAGVYTGRPWWIARTGNTKAFASWPLWLANYDYRPVLDWGLVYGQPMQPFGGWPVPKGRQYMTQEVAGINVALSVFRR